MSKKVLKGITIGITLSLICATFTPAATVRGEAMTSINQVSQRLPETVREAHSGLQPTPRGMALAQSIVSISNQGGGVIGIIASSAFHQPVEWGKLMISLDRLDTDGNWLCVEVFEYEFTKEEQPDGELTSMSVGLLIDNQPAGHYYRLRGLHEVEFLMDDGELAWEGRSTRTDGIKITKYP